MMLNKKRLTTFIFLLSIALLSTWFVLTTEVTTVKKSNPQNPDAFMLGVTATQMNKFGKPINIVTASKLVNFTQNNTTKFEDPFIIHYVDNAPPWHISAKYGQAMHGTEKIILTQQVKIRQLPGPNSHNVTFTTTQLTYHTKTSIAETDKPVTIIQPGSVVHAIGLKADLNKGYVNLLAKVKGQYDKNKAQ
jgi:LPS export ABC transporter protein LptC